MTKQELILANVVQKRAIANVVMELLEQRSLGLDGEHLSDLYDRATEIQFYFENESYKAVPDLKELRKASMKLDHILSEFLPKGKVEIGEPYLVPVGTVKLPPRPPVQIFYGWSDSAEYPTEAAIMASENFFFIPFGGVFAIPFDQVQDWKHAWFATPDTEPLKTNWDGQNSPLNKGDIGGDNLFGNPVHIGSFYYYFSTFPTIFEMPVMIVGGGTIPDVIEPGEIPETITPEPPTLTANDTLNTLTASHSLGASEILVSVNGAAYVQYTGVINVGDVDRPAGYWKFKIKAAQYRNESAVVNSPEFTKEPIVIPDQYTLTVQVNGVSTYTVYVNGAPIVGNTITVDEGTVLSNITVVRTGYNISPTSVPSVTMNQDQTLVFTATEIPVIYPDRILTVVVNGLHEPYQIFIDGVQQNGPLMFPHGTILDDITIEIEGYTVAPVDYDGIVMDQNRTVTFTATRITHTLTIDTGGISEVELYFDDVLYTGPLVFNHGNVLENVSIHKAGYTFDPINIPEVVMDQDRTIIFTGTAIPTYNLDIDVQGTTGYTLTIDGQIRTGTSFTYNEGAITGIVAVTKPGWRFTPANYPSTTMNEDKTLTFLAEEIPSYTLTFDVTGTTGYTVEINGVEQAAGVLSFTEGTVLTNIAVKKPGWFFSPLSVPTLTMDSDKVLPFEATEMEVQIVGSRNRYSNGKAIDYATGDMSFFTKHTIYYAADTFSLEFHNASTAQDYPAYDRPGFDVMTVKATVIYNEVRYPVLFSGSNSVALQMGDKIKSDVIVGLSVPDNAELTVITCVSSDGYIPTSGPSNLSIGEGWTYGDYTTSGNPSLSWGGLYAPVAVFAKPVSVRTPVVLLLGDSIMKGSPDAIGSAFIEVALKKMKIPFTNLGAGADYAKWFVIKSNNPQRWKYIESGDFTHAVIEYGFADLNDQTFSQIVDHLTSLYTQLKEYIPNVYKTTITPSTASTDDWATAGSQSTFGEWEPGRIAINGWIRSSSPYDGILDVTAFMEVNSANMLAENGGRFLTNGTPFWPTPEGIHISYALNNHIGNEMFNSPGFEDMFQLGTGEIIPETPAPTNGLLDLVTRKFNYDIPEGYVIADIEYTLNGGTTVLQSATNPLIIDDSPYGAGAIGVRIKASPVRSPSAWLFNTEALPFKADYMDGFSELVPAFISGSNQYSNGIALALNASIFENPGILPVGGEVALKYTSNTYLTFFAKNSASATYGFWLDNDGFSGDWSGYPNFKTQAAAANGFIIYSRKSLTELEVYFMETMQSERELLHTFTTTADETLTIRGDMYRPNSEMAFLQGKNLSTF